ncbi:UDP-glucuronosyl/UDP-glucosyltransferase [Dillenia turbinata]|uniref:UDP-glucuronosyl/UDP-glucosyltransferase n=1 Tax=Dillenia turbinata TaxID=194707 RepID=A0AAN8ZN12_9MAGN
MNTIIPSSENDGVLHVVVFPWLAMGHILPFFDLASRVAQRGHKVTFITTPRNLQTLLQISPSLFPPPPTLSLLTFPLSPVPSLPQNAESSTDIIPDQAPLLKIAFDSLQPSLSYFLQTSKPDWIIYDYASHWLPPLAVSLCIARAFLSLFTAASLSFFGPPSLLLAGGDRSMPEDFAVVPPWVPFQTDVVYRYHEIAKSFEVSELAGLETGASDLIRFGVAISESDVVFIRSRIEFEPDWFHLLDRLYSKPAFPVGFLPPSRPRENEDQNWIVIKEWLDQHRVDSVVYVALGTESSPSQEQITELALGLETSQLPFFWVLRRPPGSTRTESEMLPTGFEERNRSRGMIHKGWAPQVKILSHSSVGGFLTHCGWNSVVEGLSFGRVLILLPLLNDQGLNSRLLKGKGVGVEINRDERSGRFTRDSVAESLRFALVEKEGESLRTAAKEMEGLFGDREENDSYIDSFVRYLENHRR